jgi:hypothetical protein
MIIVLLLIGVQLSVITKSLSTYVSSAIGLTTNKKDSHEIEMNYGIPLLDDVDDSHDTDTSNKGVNI